MIGDVQRFFAPGGASPGLNRMLTSKPGITIILAAALLVTIFIYSSSPAQMLTGAPGTTASSKAKHWPGWSGISHMIVFGDSYSSTGFRSGQEQPSEANPLGNPDYPGDTSSNGPNWVGFLTTTYNQSFIKTLNFAFGGATVDQALIRQYLPVVKSFTDQLNKIYLPTYSVATPEFDWNADNTLFAVFFGINDVNNAYQDSIASVVLEKDIARYAELLDVIYQTGARNFLFQNVPPFDRSPSIGKQGEVAVREEGDLLAAYNKNLTRMITNFTSTYKDVTYFLHDTHKIYNEVLDNPCSHPESCPLKDVSTVCKKYAEGTANWYTSDPECALPVDQYFWLNPLHPTFRIHNVTAKGIAGLLSGKG